jgi:hypothetical protein
MIVSLVAGVSRSFNLEKEIETMSILIRKISAKAICGKIEVPKKATRLFSVFGHATKTKTGTSDYGQWTALIGRFEAVNFEDGVVSQAPQCFLPEPLNTMISEALQETKAVVDKDGEEVTDKDGNVTMERVNTSIGFSVEVGVKPSDVPIGYEYTTKENVKADTADPLAALREETQKTLPAPTKKKDAKK